MENVHINIDVENGYYPESWTDHDIEMFETMQELFNNTEADDYD